jgi:hypothetical protein
MISPTGYSPWRETPETEHLSGRYDREAIVEFFMANPQQNDLRNGKPSAEPRSEATLAGHKDVDTPMPKSGENAVNPGVGSKAGVAEGQVTKSN